MRAIWCGLAAMCFAASPSAEEGFPSSHNDALLAGFRIPPPTARPRVWWHWMNGNITIDGIAKDLDWLSRIGIGGVQNFDAALDTPQVVQNRLAYMTPEWKNAFGFAVRAADAKGLEFTIAASPGWSETGGPWVPASDGMKKLVWKSVDIVGGRRFRSLLPSPPKNTGPFLDAPRSEEMAELERRFVPPAHYEDALVLAVRLPSQIKSATPRVHSSAGDAIDDVILRDGQLDRAVKISRQTRSKAEPTYIQFDYPEDRTMRSVTLAMPSLLTIFGNAPVEPRLMSSSDGAEFSDVATIPVGMSSQTTISFPPVMARSFRVAFVPKHVPSNVEIAGGAAPGAVISPAPAAGSAAPLEVAELSLSEEPKIDRFEVKAGFGFVSDYAALEKPAQDSRIQGADLGAAPEQVVDLTDRLGKDGVLDWQAPPGHWRIIRLGWSLTGKTNHPATVEATGLEVDKYDAAAVRSYLEHYLDSYADYLGAGVPGKGIDALVTDSIEAGAANWTKGLVQEFKSLRGYDPTPWLPTLTGMLVGSRSQSDRFLYDFRTTLGEMLETNHYGVIAKLMRERGLTLYGEALEFGRATLGDDIAMRRHTTVPMAALWTFPLDKGPRKPLLGDMKGAASVAHVYGQNIAAAESLTSILQPWAYAPADLRPMIDLAFVYGINRPVIHTSPHQPVDDKRPGITLARYGQFFSRHESWAEQAKPWIEYLARSSFLLQQGRYHADVAYLPAEDMPGTVLFEKGPPADLPRMYAYDLINGDIVRELFKVEQGQLVTPSGMRYRLLQLGVSARYMTLPVLRRLADLVANGAMLLGQKPLATPSLADDVSAFRQLADALWSGADGGQYGQGRVFTHSSPDAVLEQLGVTPDFAFKAEGGLDEVLFLHRKLSDGDLFFLSSRSNAAGVLETYFAVTGKTPELWDAVTGTRSPLSYRIDNGRTIVAVPLEAYGSAFIVFRQPTTNMRVDIAPRRETELAVYDTGWSLSFDRWEGGSQAAAVTKVGDWSKQANPEVRYFSGTARYRRSIDIRREWLKPHRKLTLDLGKVGDIAAVFINGKAAGVAWQAPYEIEVTRFLRAGRNDLEIRVTNLWVNRLIGDLQPGVAKTTYTAIPTYEPDAPLRASGLLQPVRLMSEKFMWQDISHSSL